MIAKLIKTGSDYLLRDMNGEVLSITNGTTEGRKLSKQNCDEIFGVVDVDHLASEYANKRLDEEYTSSAGNFQAFNTSFTDGFNKAMELNKDKVFTLEDMRKAYFQGDYDALLEGGYTKKENDFIQSLQQPTEIEVEIVMEEISSTYLVTIGEVKTTRLEPKLDSEGCLILKRKL
jgi:hypothetical protein